MEEQLALGDEPFTVVGALPGVERAGLINGLPLASTGLLLDRVVEGRPPAPGVSAYLPARRATRVDPVVALKAE